MRADDAALSSPCHYSPFFLLTGVAGPAPFFAFACFPLASSCSSIFSWLGSSSVCFWRISSLPALVHQWLLCRTWCSSSERCIAFNFNCIMYHKIAIRVIIYWWRVNEVWRRAGPARRLTWQRCKDHLYALTELIIRKYPTPPFCPSQALPVMQALIMSDQSMLSH